MPARQIVAALLALSCTPGFAQDFPRKPVRLVIPTAAGGTQSAMARLFAPYFADAWGQQLVVDNRAGAGGIVGTQLVATAVPDGYTLLLTTGASLTANVSLHKQLPYDPRKDFAPILLLGTQPYLLVVNPSLQAGGVKDLVALAQTRSPPVSFASAGNGTSSHLAAELFRTKTGINLLHVPYKSIVTGLLDVMGGEVSLMFVSIGTGLPQVKSGKVKALASTGAKRSAAAPELPTMNEAGVAGYEASAAYCLLAPARTPRSIVTFFNQEFARVLRVPDVKERLSRDAMEPLAGPPEDLQAYIREEIDKWARVIKASNIQPM